MTTVKDALEMTKAEGKIWIHTSFKAEHFNTLEEAISTSKVLGFTVKTLWIDFSKEIPVIHIETK